MGGVGGVVQSPHVVSTDFTPRRGRSWLPTWPLLAPPLVIGVLSYSLAMEGGAPRLPSQALPGWRSEAAGFSVVLDGDRTVGA